MNKLGSLLTTTARYVETHESGSFQDTITGSVRERVVSKVIQCYKSEVKTIISALSAYPDPLLTAGGRNPDGSPANFVNWGSDFEFQGVDVAELSPNFSRLTIRYEATDPTGAAGVAGTGTPSGGIIGRPWEGGSRYIETPASGKCTDNKVYLADSLGWNRERQVELNMICEKADTRTIADAISLAPSSLASNPHNGSAITWGGGYSLISLYGSSLSPSFFHINAKYRKNQAWAIVYPPDGITLACLAGVCSIKWNSVTFEELDSQLPAISDGLDVSLINGWTALLTCNGIPFGDFTPSEAAQTSDKALAWEVSGTTAQLKFCGEIWKEFVT